MKRLLLLSLLGSLLLSGCFNVREPEKPGTTGGWTSPTQPSILLDNLRMAVVNLNPVNYERCFVPGGFDFVPDPNTEGTSSGLFINWSLLEERVYLTKLKERASVTSSNALTFSNPQEVYYNVDSLEINTRYELKLQHEDTIFRHYNFKGTMRLLMRRRQNEWQIISWQDNRSSDSLCWTDLKKHFYER